jgi:8-oxo-dGTP pyrophosphatase MutT (NUDIX family)
MSPLAAAGGVVVRRRAHRDEVCLILRDRHGPPVWGLPKGHVEVGETIKAAALREVREETGLRGTILAPLQPIRYRFILKPDPTRYDKTVHFFLMQAKGKRPLSVARHGHEVLETRWVTFDEAVAQVRFANERRVLREARRLLNARRVR